MPALRSYHRRASPAEEPREEIEAARYALSRGAGHGRRTLNSRHIPSEYACCCHPETDPDPIGSDHRSSTFVRAAAVQVAEHSPLEE